MREGLVEQVVPHVAGEGGGASTYTDGQSCWFETWTGFRFRFVVVCSARLDREVMSSQKLEIST